MALPKTADEIWPYIEKWPFGVLSFVTPKGQSRSAGVMYKVKGRVLYVVTGEDTWKVRHIRSNPNVSMTVTIQRFPIRIRQMPPAVITFSGVASVLGIDEVEEGLRSRSDSRHGRDAGDVCPRHRTGGALCHLRHWDPGDGDAPSGEVSGPGARLGETPGTVGEDRQFGVAGGRIRHVPLSRSDCSQSSCLWAL